jgi:hypothetical protein
MSQGLQEVETVLRNCIERALQDGGTLVEPADPAAWIAKQFAAWWSVRVNAALDDAKGCFEQAVEAAGGDQVGEVVQLWEVREAFEDAVGEIRISS